MILNISSIKSFQRCRLRWYYEWVLNRVPVETAKPLMYGKVLHAVFENYFKAGTGASLHDEAFMAATNIAEDAPFADSVEEAETYKEVSAELFDLAEALEFWQDKFRIDDVLEVEEPFQYEHPASVDGLEIKGRPDRVVVSMGRIFHMQHRSLAASKNIGLYTETAKQDMHELIYAWALRQKYGHTGLTYGGTIFNIIRKLKYRGKNGKILNEPDKMFGQYHVWMEDKFIGQALMDVHHYAQDMQGTLIRAQHGILPPHNRDLNAGMYGNKKDAFFDVICGKVDIMDPKYFKDREDTYAPVVEE